MDSHFYQIPLLCSGQFPLFPYTHTYSVIEPSVDVIYVVLHACNSVVVKPSPRIHLTTSGEHKINIAATKPTAAWIEEGGALSFGDATFDQILLDAHKLHVAIKVTEELLYDNAFNLESYIIDMFGKALANAEEDDHFTVELKSGLKIEIEG